MKNEIIQIVTPNGLYIRGSLKDVMVHLRQVTDEITLKHGSKPMLKDLIACADQN